ncbi:uncharacterized protein LACBIDRAFT_331027 [Laccaria bicolor S238N-H82]|uniref:Predicted protein n=1 Tax=Laccaria bicolor (strain S238N-H82 / ATCC MYA-4686) TaxID=486041 RepID=B0DN73_LACBS|nr:uncharacterized protein LACBIDRAFT_331027 [Laccaria bicolor S238N-H82]EDR03886.1 predicted protein [Laccaria bicolor S238N-H82]|eukprot:XP_001885454.1 predicted protein [Laccaria bicolor S238N-H82]
MDSYPTPRSIVARHPCQVLSNSSSLWSATADIALPFPSPRWPTSSGTTPANSVLNPGKTGSPSSSSLSDDCRSSDVTRASGCPDIGWSPYDSMDASDGNTEGFNDYQSLGNTFASSFPPSPMTMSIDRYLLNYPQHVRSLDDQQGDRWINVVLEYTLARSTNFAHRIKGKNGSTVLDPHRRSSIASGENVRFLLLNTSGLTWVAASLQSGTQRTNKFTMLTLLAKNHTWTEKPEIVVRVAFFLSDLISLIVDTIVSAKFLRTDVHKTSTSTPFLLSTQNHDLSFGTPWYFLMGTPTNLGGFLFI